MTAQNKHRGDAVVTLGGIEYTLRPSFAALVEMESRAGIGILPLAIRFGRQEFGLSDVIAVLAPAIKAGGQEVPKNLGEMMLAGGVTNMAMVCARLLGEALVGDAKNDAAPPVP